MSDGLSGGGGLPVAGWYPDPAGTPQERWWGGLDWTDHLRDVPPGSGWSPTSIGMPSSGAIGEPPAPVQSGYKPMGGSVAEQHAPGGRFYRPPAGSPNTVPIWFLAVSPIVGFIVTLVAIVSSLPTEVLAIGITLGSIVAVVIAVFWDTVVLKERNLPIASPLFLLVGLIGPPLGLVAYLLMRSIVLGRDGYKNPAPNVVFGASVLALIGLIYLLPTLLKVLLS